MCICNDGCVFCDEITFNGHISFRPEDLDVKIDGQQLCVTASQDVGEGGWGRSRVFEQRSAVRGLGHSISLIF